MRLKGIWWQPIGDAVLPVAVEIHLTKYDKDVHAYHYPLTDQQVFTLPKHLFYVTKDTLCLRVDANNNFHSNLTVNINSPLILSKVKDILSHKYY